VGATKEKPMVTVDDKGNESVEIIGSRLTGRPFKTVTFFQNEIDTYKGHFQLYLNQLVKPRMAPKGIIFKKSR